MATSNGLGGETVEKYRQCQHNYAAEAMRCIYDGCGDFVAKGESETPEFFLCEVCGCHRNYHKREEIVLPSSQHQATRIRIIHRTTTTASPQPHSPPLQQPLHINPPLELPQMKAINSEEIEEMGMKRRRRTKFTQAQKDQMRVFAERLGWQLKGHYKEIHLFCEDIGITRQVLKVWIHNNKRLMKSGQSSSTPQT